MNKISLNTAEKMMITMAFVNLHLPEDRKISLFLLGSTGAGKTAICKEAAAKVKGSYIKIPGEQLMEGDITGIPVKNDGAESDMLKGYSFIPHNSIRNIIESEKAIFERVTTVGLLEGSLRMDPKTGVTTYRYKDKDGSEKSKTFPRKFYFDSDRENKFKFGDNLPAEIKRELYLSGDIKINFTNIDELNRADMNVHKQLMNVFLEHNVNGYILPWWVNLVGTGNPSDGSADYDTTSFDKAGSDRFVILNIRNDAEEWVNGYGIPRGFPQDILMAIKMNPALFSGADTEKFVPADTQTGSPRSWEMVSYIYQYYPFYERTLPYFSASERGSEEDTDQDLRILIGGKIGETAANTLFATIKGIENKVTPSEIVNGKSPKIDDKVIAKLNKQAEIEKKFTIDYLLSYLLRFLPECEKAGGNPEHKNDYANALLQIKEFFELLSGGTLLQYAGQKVAISNMECDDGMDLFSKIGECFSAKAYDELMKFRAQNEKMKGV